MVLIIDLPHQDLLNRIQAMGMDYTLATDWTREAVMANIGSYHGLVLRSRFRLDRTMLEAADKLVWIAREGVGVEHIDLETAGERGIHVLTSPEGSADKVAEHTIGLLLSLLHRISTSHGQIRKHQWLREPNRGVELCGKTVALLGYGNMGQAVAQRLKCFRTQVLAYDRYLTGFGNDFAKEASLSEIFERADILSLHFPYTQENHYFINDDFLCSFHNPIYLVNTARGSVLETAALVRQLKRGQVLGAALDVLEYEDVSFNAYRLDTVPAPLAYLLSSEQVVMTPHLAGSSVETKQKHAEVLAGKISALEGTG
ncbi:MAG: hypothetical protein RLY31_3123 [Bacteroidota bacterium]|jgi:D-3-phosphoglycerate dehydrogenase